VFVSRRVSFTEAEVRVAVADALSYSDVLRSVGLRPAGGNHATIRRYVEEVWKIPTDHFDPVAASVRGLRRGERLPLSAILVEGSNYSRQQLKERLYAEGLKARLCELCGQGEEWRGRRMSLILDHINGRATDNRLDNLRIVCPNCNATLETHCGRNKPRRARRVCERCAVSYLPSSSTQRFCSRRCAALRTTVRRVERPPYAQLLAEIAATSYCAVGRKYGVSDNAIRKWVREYEREASAGGGEALAQSGDELTGRVALGEHEVDAVDAVDGALGLVDRQGRDDGQQR
jgi:hypothetical protein